MSFFKKVFKAIEKPFRGSGLGSKLKKEAGKGMTKALGEKGTEIAGKAGKAISFIPTPTLVPNLIASLTEKAAEQGLKDKAASDARQDAREAEAQYNADTAATESRLLGQRADTLSGRVQTDFTSAQRDAEEDVLGTPKKLKASKRKLIGF